MTDSAPAFTLPTPLKRLGARALESALNHLLTLDPETRQALAALDGRVLTLALRGPGLAFALTVHGERLAVGPAPAESALKVSATPASLLALALRRDGVAPGSVEIAGDADLARRLEKLASRFRPDFEEAFARAFGDVLGVPLARGVRQALARLGTGTAHAVEDGADWLRDEARIALAPGEMDGFLDDVDALRERSERLAARLARLEARHGGRPA